MKATMSFSSRRELFFQVAPRYRAGNRKEKQVILVDIPHINFRYEFLWFPRGE